MTQHTPPVRPLRTQRAQPLRGTLAVPADPVVAIRALAVAAITPGETRFPNLPRTEAVNATMRALRLLGVGIEESDPAVLVNGLGPGLLLAPRSSLSAGTSAELATLLIGLVGVQPFTTEIAGTADLPAGVAEVVEQLGGRIELTAGGLPLRITGPRTPVPGAYPIHAHAAKTALLLAGAGIPGETTAIEAAPSLDHIEHVLAAFGANVDAGATPEGTWATRIAGLPDLRAREVVLPGDPEIAAILLISGLIATGSDLLVEGVMLNPYRAALLNTLMELSANLRLVEQTTLCGEDVATLRVRPGGLTGATIDAGQARAIGGSLPLVILIAAFAQGNSAIQGVPPDDAEGGWLAAVKRGLTANGVQWDAEPGTLIVHGQGRVSGGGLIPAHPDARVPLMFLLMGMATRDPVTVMDDSPIAIRYPGVLEALSTRGAQFKREGQG